MPSKKIPEEEVPVVITEEDRIREIVTAYLFRLTSAPDDYEIKKEIVCPFYKEGKQLDCIGCSQPNDIVDTCEEEYRWLMRKKPALVYSLDLERPLPRAPVSILDKTIVTRLNCESCYASKKCPMYNPGYACGIDWGVDIPTDGEEIYAVLINAQSMRLRRAMLNEELDGGVPDAVVSNEMDRLSDLVKSKKDFSAEGFSMHMSASGPPRQGGGVLERIFGSAIKPVAEKTDES